MKGVVIICLMSLTSLTGEVCGQTDVRVDDEVGGRLTFGLNKRVSKGLHVCWEEAVWFDGNLSSFNRLQSTLSVRYKVLPWLKVGVGYSLINGYEGSSFNPPRHRLMADVTGSYQVGDWQFSLRERVQMTHRTDSYNEWQTPGNAWMLKSRLKVTYKAFRRWEPYGTFEVRNMLNAPVVKATYNETTGIWVSSETGLAANEAGWFLDGFNSVYINRLRGTLGVSYRINRGSVIDVCLMGDFMTEKKVDANAKGTKLKAYTRETNFVGWLAVEYSYMF